MLAFKQKHTQREYHDAVEYSRPRYLWMYVLIQTNSPRFTVGDLDLHCDPSGK